MNRPIFTPAARADLLAIWQFIAERNPRAADGVMDDMLAACDMLAQMPRAGRPRPDLGRAIRSFPVGPYLILYRVVRRRVEIGHVADGRRHLPDLLQ